MKEIIHGLQRDKGNLALLKSNEIGGNSLCGTRNAYIDAANTKKRQGKLNTIIKVMKLEANSLGGSRNTYTDVANTNK